MDFDLIQQEKFFFFYRKMGKKSSLDSFLFRQLRHCISYIYTVADKFA